MSWLSLKRPDGTSVTKVAIKALERIPHTIAVLNKHSEIEVQEEYMEHMTTFFSPDSSVPVHRLVSSQLVTVNSKWTSDSMASDKATGMVRGYIEKYGPVHVEHGQGYPSNISGMNKFTKSTTRFFACITSTGFYVSTDGARATRLIFTKPEYFIYNCEKMADFDDKEVQLQFKGLCNEEFISESHNTATESAFCQKFVLIKKIMLRKAFTEDLSVLREFACRFPLSDIKKYVPQAVPQAQVQAVPQAQVQAVPQAQVQAVPQAVPQAQVLAVSVEAAEAQKKAERLAREQAFFEATHHHFKDLVHTEPFPDKMDELSPDELSFFV